MKFLTIILLAATAIGLGACAHREQQSSGGGMSSMSSTSMHHSYSK